MWRAKEGTEQQIKSITNNFFMPDMVRMSFTAISFQDLTIVKPGEWFSPGRNQGLKLQKINWISNCQPGCRSVKRP